MYRRGLEMQGLIDGEVRPNYEPLALEKRNTESIQALYSIGQGVWAVICNIIAAWLRGCVR